MKSKPNECPVCGREVQVMAVQGLGLYFVQCGPYIDYGRCLVGPERKTIKDAVKVWNSLVKKD